MSRYKLNESHDADAVSMAISSLRDGNTKVLKMYSDEYIRQYASKKDFEFWVSEKNRTLSPMAAA